jgi:kinesin family member C2/C3
LLLQDNIDTGSMGKIVDSVISLKSYHEWKKGDGANGPLKYIKSPLATRSSLHQPEHVASGPSPSQKCLHLVDADGQPSKNVDRGLEEAEAEADKQPSQSTDQG